MEKLLILNTSSLNVFEVLRLDGFLMHKQTLSIIFWVSINKQLLSYSFLTLFLKKDKEILV